MGGKMGTFIRYRFCLIMILLVSSVPLAAQSITGTILGTIFDPSQAVVSGAKVTVTNMGQGWTLNVTSDSLGSYTFTHLPPGKYQVQVSSPGFQSLTVPDIEV